MAVSCNSNSLKLTFNLAQIHDMQKKFAGPVCRPEGARSVSFELVLFHRIFFYLCKA